MKAYWGTEI